MKIWSSHLLDNLSNCLMNLKNLQKKSEVMGSNPVESPEFFRFTRQLLKLSSKCEDHIFIWWSLMLSSYQEKKVAVLNYFACMVWNSYAQTLKYIWIFLCYCASLSVRKSLPQLTSPTTLRLNLLQTRRWTKMARIFRILKIHSKLRKQHVTIIFSSTWSGTKKFFDGCEKKNFRDYMHFKIQWCRRFFSFWTYTASSDHLQNTRT